MAESLTILVVDDDEVDRTAVVRNLHAAETAVTVTEALSMEEAFGALEAAAFDCIFLDLRLPGIDGLTGLAQIRAQGVRTPVVILTGQGDENTAVEAMKAGATDYLTKAGLTGEGLQRALRGALVGGYRYVDEQLQGELERAEVTLRAITDAVITTDRAGVVDYLNPAAEELCGWARGEAQGKLLTSLISLLDEITGEAVSDPIRACIVEGAQVALSGEIALVNRHDERYLVQGAAAPLRGRGAQLIGAVLTLQDVTQNRRLVKDVAFLANHDPLTGLRNRTAFESQLARALMAARELGLPHVLGHLDLDKFKLVNGACGHLAGDELFKAITARVKACLPETATLARLGDDELGILLECCPLDRGREVAERARAAVAGCRLPWKGKTAECTASIGLVPITAESHDVHDLVSAAESACYAAKEGGKNRVHIYQPGDAELAERRGEMQWVHEINQALASGRFQLYGQPIVPLWKRGHSNAHWEVLLRHVDEGGLLTGPAQFLPAAERFHLMPLLDRWVFRTTVEMLRDAGLADAQHLELSVNLSGQTLSDEGFLQHVIDGFNKTGVDPAHICFEITESAAIGNLAQARHFIAVLKNVGSRFSLDDFGTGLSSFRYLKSLPVDYLKIDGSFVKHMAEDPHDFAIVRAANEIALVMGLQTIAEYVSNDNTVTHLRRLGVDYAQGYRFGEPRALAQLLAELSPTLTN